MRLTIATACLITLGWTGTAEAQIRYTDHYSWPVVLTESTGPASIEIHTALRWSPAGQLYHPGPPQPTFTAQTYDLTHLSRWAYEEIVGSEVRVEFAVDAWLYMPPDCAPSVVPDAATWIGCVSGARAEVFSPYVATGHLLAPVVTTDPRTGDLNGDKSIDAADAALLFLTWNAGLYDLNRDGYTDAADAGILFQNWTGDSMPSPVPEPASHVVVSLCGLIVGSSWKRT